MSHVKNGKLLWASRHLHRVREVRYNPYRPTLQLKAMRALPAEAQSSLQHVSHNEMLSIA